MIRNCIGASITLLYYTLPFVENPSKIIIQPNLLVGLQEWDPHLIPVSVALAIYILTVEIEYRILFAFVSNKRVDAVNILNILKSLAENFILKDIWGFESVLIT